MDNKKNILLYGILAWIIYSSAKYEKPYYKYKKRARNFKDAPYRYMYSTMPRRYKKMMRFSKRLNK